MHSHCLAVTNRCGSGGESNLLAVFRQSLRRLPQMDRIGWTGLGTRDRVGDTAS